MNPIKLAFYDEKKMQWNQTDKLQRLKIPRFNPRPCKENDMVSLFGFLSFEETTVGESNYFSTSRPQTAAPRLPRPEHQPLRIPQTDRSDRSRPNSASFVSPDNLKRFAIGVCESPILIKEFKSCINILFQITYSERLSRVFISGDKPAIYTYTNFLGVRNVESKLEVLVVSKEPQGLAMGLTGNLLYSDGFNGVVEIEPNIIDDIQHHTVIKIQRNARTIFNKKGYTTWGVHCTKSGEFLTTFTPRGIACSGQGHILVADVENDLVHMLQKDGQFITHILSSISPISRPWGICVDAIDRLWLVEEQKYEGGVKCLAKVKVFQIYKKGL